MKTPLFFLIGLCLAQPLFAIVISDIVISGNNETDRRAILFFFPEYEQQTHFSAEGLSRALSNWNRRLERTGWFRDIKISNTFITENETVVFLDLTERLFYTARLFDNAIGFGKQNLWGKGKEVFFEVGPIQRRITLADHMYNFSRFFYEISLGTGEKDIMEYRAAAYHITPTLRQEGSVAIGYHLFPDTVLSLGVSGQIIQHTNHAPLSEHVSLSLSYLIDMRRGYPAFISGWNVDNHVHWHVLSWAVSWEAMTSWHFPLDPKWQIGFMWGHGLTYGELHHQEKFNLRTINGLRTLSHAPGLIGNNFWHADMEIRWKFWDVIPFIIFDMQLEAVGFIESGQAWDAWQTFGQHIHFIGGGGLRIYVGRFAIRTEAGIDHTGETAVLSSFELPF